MRTQGQPRPNRADFEEELRLALEDHAIRTDTGLHGEVVEALTEIAMAAEPTEAQISQARDTFERTQDEDPEDAFWRRAARD